MIGRRVRRGASLATLMWMLVVASASAQTQAVFARANPIPDNQDFKNEIIRIETQLRGVEKSVDQLRVEVGAGLKDMRHEIREDGREHRQSEQSNITLIVTIFSTIGMILLSAVTFLTYRRQTKFQQPPVIMHLTLLDVIDQFQLAGTLDPAAADAMRQRVTEKYQSMT